jgi:hypothetical protein
MSYGRIPYGSRLGADGVSLEAHPAEARMLARLLTLRADGETWQGIAERLNAEGYRNRAGRQWISRTFAPPGSRPQRTPTNTAPPPKRFNR